MNSTGRAAPGTAPPGVTSEVEAARWVRRMFGSIAPRYDVVNHLLSLNIDRLWRRELVRALRPVFLTPKARVLDLCCGTGDVLLALAGAGSCDFIGADFCHPMLLAAQAKADERRVPAKLIEADALQLPFASGSMDAISIAFGFRNLANYEAGLQELHRILKPNGVLAILEFSNPRSLAMRLAYGFYSKVFVPNVGSLLSGKKDAYRYLPKSIRRFPSPEELRALMQAAGFTNVRFRLLTGGIAALHTGVKEADS